MLENQFNTIIQLIEQRKERAYRKVNEELITLYWEVGQFLNNLAENSKYGDKIIDKAAEYMKTQYPNIKGFTRSNMYRMVQFYNTYKDLEKVAPLVRQLSWSNNLLILGATKTVEEKEFYIKMSIKDNYSKRELSRQIASGYYQRYMLSEKNAREHTKNISDEKDYPKPRILDTYCLEFLNLSNTVSEKELKKAVVNNLKEFILEIGKDFTFVGEEYKLQVGNKDFYIDLLFYNRVLSCMVAFELKIGPFKPEYISKMDFYLEALDRQERKKNENPSVGVILCSSKNAKVVEYTISRTLSPTMVSEYKLRLIDKELLEEKLKEIIQAIERNKLKTT